MVAIGAIVGVLAPTISYAFGWLFICRGSRRWTAGRLEQLLGHVRHGLVGALVQCLSPTAGRAGGERRRHALGRVRVVLRRDAGAVCPLHEDPAEAGGLRRPEGCARLRSGDARRTHSAAPGSCRSCRRDRRGDRGARYRVSESGMAGRTIGDVGKAAPGVAIELVRRGTEWVALDETTALAAGDEVVISGPVDKQVRVREVLGPELPDAEARAETAAYGRCSRRPRPGRRAIGARSARSRAVSECRLPRRHRTAGRCGDHAREGRRDSCDGHRRSTSTSLGSRVGQVVRAGHTSDVLTLALGLLAGALLGADSRAALRHSASVSVRPRCS